MAVAKLVRGTFLRIAVVRFQSAYISVAVSRSTDRRRIVEASEPDHHHHRIDVGEGWQPPPQRQDRSSSLHCGRSVLTQWPCRLPIANYGPTSPWSGAPKRRFRLESRDHLTCRFTSVL
jgi:hypothetical protein